MTEAHDAVDDEEERWAQAESILRGTPTPDAVLALRRYRRSIWRIVAVCIGIVVAAGVSIPLMIGRRHHVAVHHEVPVAQAITGLVVAALGLIVVVIGFVVLMRSRDWGAEYRAPALVLNRRQRRALMQQIRGRAPVDSRHLALARDVAGRFSRLRGYQTLLAGGVLIGVAQVILSPDLWRLVSPMVMVVGLTGALIFQRRIIREAHRFLEANPE